LEGQIWVCCRERLESLFFKERFVPGESGN
jgi:hypothetical protein